MNILNRFSLLAMLVLLVVLGIGGFFLLRGNPIEQQAAVAMPISTAEVPPVVSDKSPLPTSSSTQQLPPQKTVEEPTQPKSEVIPKSTPTGNTTGTQSTASKFLTVQFVNQYGVIYFTGCCTMSNMKGPYLLDALGEEVPGRFNAKKMDEKEGYLYIFDKEIPPGTYTVGWYGGNSNSTSGGVLGVSPPKYSVERQYSAGTKKVVMPSNRNWFFSVPIEQTEIMYGDAAYITLKIQNEVGTEIGSNQDATVYNAAGKVVGDLLPNKSGFSVYFLGHPHPMPQGMPPGKYTINIKKDSYQPKDIDFILPEVSTWSDERIWNEQPGVIDLGTIVLKKI